MNRMRNAITITPELAHSTATDAANRQMRKSGRRKWSRADYNLAVQTQARLLRHLGYDRIAKDMQEDQP